MKLILTLWMSIFVLCLSNVSSHAQTYVNQDWIKSGGLPNGIYDFQASHVDNAGKVVTVGNTFHYGQAENFLIVKRNSDGTLVFQKEYDGTFSNTDFATDVTTIGKDTYVTDVEGDTVTGTSSITTMKLDSLGNILWTEQYHHAYNKYNLGFRIIPNSTGTALFVCGTSQTGLADFAMTIIRYKTSGGAPEWVATYDSIGLYDAGIDMKASSTSLVVYGVSGLSSTSGDIIVRSINPNTGALLAQSRINNVGAYVTRPVAIAKDKSENIYLTGISSDAGRMDDIVIIKLDSLLNLKWRKYIDGGNNKNDGVSAIKVDTRNNIILTGWAANADSSKAIWTLKMKDSVIIWDKKRLCPTPGQDGKGFDVDLDVANNIYVTGKIYNQGKFTQITISSDSSGIIQWEQFYNNAPNSNDEGRNIKVDSGGSVIVYGRSLLGMTYTYSTMKYRSTTIPMTFERYPSGVPFYMQNQLLVNFNPKDVDTIFSNNGGVKFATLSKILPSSLLTSLSAKLGISVGSLTAVKVYPGLTPKVTYSIARNGDTVPLAPLWSHFLVYFPNGYFKTGDDYKKAMDSLMSSSGHVQYIQLNYCGHLDNSPNDYQYGYNQAALHPTSTYPIGHIYAEGAWDIETGKSHIRVGVYDTGIDFRDDDFCFNNFANCIDRVKDGWNINTGQNAMLEVTPDKISHGTSCASIIGAVRNNYATGHVNDIASVAGGQYISGDTANNNTNGVSLYNFNIFYYVGPPYDTIVWTTAYNVAQSLRQGTILNSNYPYNYGVHIINCSWGFSPDTTSTSVYQMKEIENAIRDVVRNKVTVIASTGNTGKRTVQFPSSFYDERVISVGGSAGFGEWAPGASYGGDIDVTAPYAAYLVTTLDTGNRVKGFEGTSASAPHVSGIVALLYSYVNTTDTSFNNLESEDCEYIIQKSGSVYPFHSDTVGYGKVNASAALHAVQKPHYYVKHYDNKRFPATWTRQIIATDTLIQFKYFYGDDSGRDAYVCTNCCNYELPNFNTHRADIYKVTVVVSHNLQPNEQIQDSWVRANASNLLGGLTGNATIMARNQLTISNVTHNTATLTAYFYLIKDTLTHTAQCWYPLGVADTLSMKLSYSLRIWDGISTSVEEIKELGYSIALFPNPSASSNTVLVQVDKAQQLSILLYDIQGKFIKNVFEGQGTIGANTFVTDLHDLNTGVYIYKIQGENFTKSVKFTKY